MNLDSNTHLSQMPTCTPTSIIVNFVDSGPAVPPLHSDELKAFGCPTPQKNMSRYTVPFTVLVLRLLPKEYLEIHATPH